LFLKRHISSAFSYFLPLLSLFHYLVAQLVGGTCPCHEDEELIAEVAELVEDGTLSPDDATDIVSGKYW
jgi:hypothetical protein